MSWRRWCPGTAPCCPASAETSPGELPSGAISISARSAPTVVSGFPHKTKRVRTRQKVSFKVKVKGPQSVRRSVRLQQKSAGRWRTTVKRRTNAGGVVRLKWTAPKKPQTLQMRVVVPRSGRSGRMLTAPRKIVVTAKTSKTPQSLADLHEAGVLTLINKVRSHAQTCGGTRYPAVKGLKRNSALDRAARKFAQRMADEEFFDHVSPDGDGPTDRARAEGYRGGVGENIAAGYSTPAAVMDEWLARPGHCANLMHADYKVVGIGFAVPKPGLTPPFSSYWVQDFGMNR